MKQGEKRVRSVLAGLTINGKSFVCVQGSFQNGVCGRLDGDSDVRRRIVWRVSHWRLKVLNAVKIEDSLIKMFVCFVFDRVKLLVNKRTGDTVALKSINLKNRAKLEEHCVTAKELEKMVTKEMTIHVNLQHENIIKFYGSRVDDSQIFMFLEYAQGGELYDRIGTLKSHY